MTSTTATSDDIKLSEAVEIIWAEKYRVLLWGVVGGLLMLLYLANTLPTYQADGLLQFEDRRRSMAVPSSMAALVSETSRTPTEIEVLRSRLVLRQAVADMNLDWIIEPYQLPLLGTMFARYRFPLIDGLIPVDHARPGDRVVLSELIVPPRWLTSRSSLSSCPTADLRWNCPMARWSRACRALRQPCPSGDFRFS